jgi:cytochrome c oxidase subunit 2
LRRLGGAGLALAAGALGAGRLLAQESEGRVIEIQAQRFHYTPAEVRVRQGEVVTLAIKAIDFTHGFSMPELGMRRDLIPGQVVKLRLPPQKPGRYTFLCDNFCGEGHEEMNGMLIVEA